MINQGFLKTLNVLYVEDSNTIRRQFSSILEKLFNKVIVAENGKDALNQYHNNEIIKIDIVISDINMPIMNGVELLERIRKIDPEMPFVITTAHTETDFLLQAVKFQATDYLIKPINTKKLIYAVQKVCQSRYHENLKKQTLDDLNQITEVVNEVALVSKTNLEGNITFVNKRFCDVCEYSENEILGHNHWFLRHQDIEQTVINNLNRQIQQGNIWEGKLHNVSKSKEDYYLCVTVIPLFDEADVNVIAFMWISFLTTQDEKEKKDFKTKVIKNVNETRRVNLQARKTIDKLQNKLLKYKHFDVIEYSLDVEKKRSSKFKNQVKYYEKEVKDKEIKLDSMSKEVDLRINKATMLSQEQAEKNDIALLSLQNLTSELKEREDDVGILNKEIQKQLNLIEQLKGTINQKEEELGIE